MEQAAAEEISTPLIPLVVTNDCSDSIEQERLYASAGVARRAVPLRASLSRVLVASCFAHEPTSTNVEEEPSSTGPVEEYKPTSLPAVVSVKSETLDQEYLSNHYSSLCKTLKVRPLKHLFDMTEIVHKYNEQMAGIRSTLSRSFDVYLLVEDFPEGKKVCEENCTSIM